MDRTRTATSEASNVLPPGKGDFKIGGCVCANLHRKT